jgi:hypothetical protein
MTSFLQPGLAERSFSTNDRGINTFTANIATLQLRSNRNALKIHFIALS